MSAIAVPSVRPSVPNTVVTPEDLLHMEEQGLFELVDGQLVEKTMSVLSNLVAGEITFVLKTHLKAAKMIGYVIPEQSFQCFPRTPSQIRRPDVAFISPARMPAVLPEGHLKFPPDLAIEVVSPTDKIYEQDEKLLDYRSAAIPLVWVINPEARIVRVHRLGQPVEELYDGDTLRGEPVLPGFAVGVTGLLPAVVAEPVQNSPAV